MAGPENGRLSDPWSAPHDSAAGVGRGRLEAVAAVERVIVDWT